MATTKKKPASRKTANNKKSSSKKTTSTVTKSSITGKFVRTTTVDRHPRTTVTETVKKPKPKAPRGKKSGK